MFANIIISVGVSIPAFLSDVNIITQVAAKVKACFFVNIKTQLTWQKILFIQKMCPLFALTVLVF